MAGNNLGGAALRNAMAAAEASARQAIALAPGLGYPLTALAFTLENRLDLRAAADAYAAAYKASPGDAGVLRRAATFASHMRKGDEAIGLIRRAATLDPLRPTNSGLLGIILLNAGRVDEAIPELRAGLEALPSNGIAASTLAAALLVKGQPGPALKAMAALPPDDPIRLMIECASYAATDRPASDRALAMLNGRYGTNAQYQIAAAHSWRREPDLAFAAIARAWDLIDPGLVSFYVDPLLAPIRTDPRYREWLGRIGFL
jgi:tetratricopeptide (TPR) repeat protein